MTIEQLLKEFGDKPLLRNIADILESKANQAWSPFESEYNRVAARKILALAEELEKDEKEISQMIMRITYLVEKKDDPNRW